MSNVPQQPTGGAPSGTNPNGAPQPSSTPVQPASHPQQAMPSQSQPAAQPAPAHHPNWFQRHVRRRIDAIPLSTKLVACIIVLLTIGSFALSFSIRQLVSNYMLEKTDKQLFQTRDLVVNGAEWLKQSDSAQQDQQNQDQQDQQNEQDLGLNTYFLQVRDLDYKIVENKLELRIGKLTSVPSLPATGSMDGVELGVPFTTDAIVRQDSPGTVDRTTLASASAPWRVLPLSLSINGKPSGYAFIGLSLKDVIDTTDILTRYSAMVGIAVVLLGGVIGTLLVQTTLTPLKRIEKTAAKIAAGDLSQRVPSAPENTEVGSLAASLNSMLARIEQSFHEQQETTEKMKRFVSDASHELRTPLAAIHGYAELYKMQREFPGALERADESIEHIEASSARMTVLVEDLLSLARLDEGRGIDLTQQVPLTSIVSDATEDLHALDPERGIRKGRLTIERPADGSSGARFMFEEGDMPQVTLSGDGSRLRQVVTNIVGNIHRYTPADSPVEVSMGVLPASISPESLSRMPATEASMRHLVEAVEVGQSMQVGMNYAFLRFADHGPGVPEESRSQIFERFYTADPSRARLKGGTGLGMAIALSVVKAHRGFICASGTEGGGLTLTVVLPVAPVEPTVVGPTSAGAVALSGPGSSAKPDKKTRAR